MINNTSQWRSDPNAKKKFDCFVAENSSDNNESKQAGGNEAPTRPVIKTGSVNGFSFVGQFGNLDCSIGTIFRDEFGKNLKMPKPNSSDGRALSVLIIDDSIIQRKLTMRTLGGLIDEVMWMVEGAENGECALNLIETSPRVPDVIIVDQYMESSGGRLLGHEVVAELRSSSVFDSAVIVGCTGSAEEASPLFLSAGCDTVWSKPMPSKDEARAQIMALLQQRNNMSLTATNSGRSSSNSSFTIENVGGFSNGIAGNSPQQQPQQQLQQQQETAQKAAIPLPAQQPPVFLQMQTARISSGNNPPNQSSYILNGGSTGTGSVFQFGSPPATTSSVGSNANGGSGSSAPAGDIVQVTEAIFHIDMQA